MNKQAGFVTVMTPVFCAHSCISCKQGIIKSVILLNFKEPWKYLGSRRVFQDKVPCCVIFIMLQVYQYSTDRVGGCSCGWLV